MSRYEVRNMGIDWGLFEVSEDEKVSKASKKLPGELIWAFNNPAHAMLVREIIEEDNGIRTSAFAGPRSAAVDEMSDAECVAVNYLCCAGGHQCHACPVQSTEDEEAKCFDVERRVLQMAERWLLYRRPLEMVVRFQSLEEIEASLARSRKLLKETIAQSETTGVSKEVLTVLNKIESRVAEVIKGLEIECKQGCNPYFRTNGENRIEGLHYALKIIRDNKKKYTGGKTDENISD